MVVTCERASLAVKLSVAVPSPMNVLLSVSCCGVGGISDDTILAAVALSSFLSPRRRASGRTCPRVGLLGSARWLPVREEKLLLHVVAALASIAGASSLHCLASFEVVHPRLTWLSAVSFTAVAASSSSCAYLPASVALFELPDGHIASPSHSQKRLPPKTKPMPSRRASTPASSPILSKRESHGGSGAGGEAGGAGGDGG